MKETDSKPAPDDGRFMCQCAICDTWIDHGKKDDELGAVCLPCHEVLKVVDNFLDVACHVLGMRPTREDDQRNNKPDFEEPIF